MSFLQEFDVVVSQGSGESRERALWYATDLLIVGRYTEDEIWMFGEIIGRLERDIETATRAKLAKRLARTDNAPFKVIDKLAFDDSIEVAGPVLRQSQRIDTRTLIANARSKSQNHLLAISKRKSLCEGLTDELVSRGNSEVVRSVAENHGAQFSDFGILHMIKRSESDSILFEQLGHRKDIPRHTFQQLIAKASDNAKKRLESERPEAAGQIRNLVTDVTGALHAKFGPASKDYFHAKRAVAKQHHRGNLNEKQIAEYAQSHEFEETTVGLALLCSLPVDVVERALLDKNRDIVLLLAKALAFSWETTMALLFLGAPVHRIMAHDLEAMKQKFAELSAEMSKGVLEAYRSRRQAVAADSENRRLPQLHAS
ncbi:DUF2336 domain-containing protein [Bradyrhizobium sp.]|uniref:DUF2336 domain-containing protein n=1 Tax=Bradyrhizobium sp. TaxID=376 RepID=UPI003BE052C9